MVVSVGHFDSDQDEFVVDGKLHNGTALPGSSDDWQRSVERLHDGGHDVALEFERITRQHRLDRRMVERPASHPRDEYSLMMKMKTPYRMASILPPESEYDALESIANDADQIDLPSRDAVEENPASIRRYSGPADGQPLSFTILYETGHVAIHAREHCAHEGHFVFQVDPDDIARLFDAAYDSGFGDLEHTYLGAKDSLAATSLGVCAGDDQQWVYAYTDAPPTAFEQFDRAILDVSGTRLFETGEPGALEAALTSSRVAPALALLASEQDLIEQLPADVVLSGVRTGLESQQAMTCYDALEVLSVLGGPVPDTTWTALTQCEYRHPDVVHEIASMLAA